MLIYCGFVFKAVCHSHVYYNFTIITIYIFLALPSINLLLSVSKQLQDYNNFLVGYMGYTIEEVVTNMYLSQDYKSCVLKMLSLWRCKYENDKVKTVGELLSVMEDVLLPSPYKSLKTVVNGKYNNDNDNEIALIRHKYIVILSRMLEEINSALLNRCVNILYVLKIVTAHRILKIFLKYS